MLDPTDWVGGVVPCCGNCAHWLEKMLFENECNGPELRLGKTDKKDLCEQHTPIHGIVIKHIDEDRIVAEFSAFIWQEEIDQKGEI